MFPSGVVEDTNLYPSVRKVSSELSLDDNAWALAVGAGKRMARYRSPSISNGSRLLVEPLAGHWDRVASTILVGCKEQTEAVYAALKLLPLLGRGWIAEAPPP